jgi:hypothetical protein
MIIGVMMLLMMQALAELAVMYPVNGAFYQYIVRFVDPSWWVNLHQCYEPGIDSRTGGLQWDGITRFNGSPSCPLKLPPRV